MGVTTQLEGEKKEEKSRVERTKLSKHSADFYCLNEQCCTHNDPGQNFVTKPSLINLPILQSNVVVSDASVY